MMHDGTNRTEPNSSRFFRIRFVFPFVLPLSVGTAAHDDRVVWNGTTRCLVAIRPARPQHFHHQRPIRWPVLGNGTRLVTFEVAPALFSRRFGNPTRQRGEERTLVFPCLRGGFPIKRNF